MMTDIRSLHDTSHSDSLQSKTDFSLCIKCQVAEGTLLNSPQPESHTKNSSKPLHSMLNWTMVIFQL